MSASTARSVLDVFHAKAIRITVGIKETTITMIQKLFNFLFFLMFFIFLYIIHSFQDIFFSLKKA